MSIITATYNAAHTLRQSMASLDSQDTSVEHIVVDGVSTDSTLGILNDFGASVSRIVSEPDRGLYDALNKGIKLSEGDVVGILHADDFYASPRVLGFVSEVFQDNSVDSCYGDLVYVADSFGKTNTEKSSRVVRYWSSGEYRAGRFYWGWMPPHPTFFVRRSIYEKYGFFNLDMGTAADYELMLRFLLKYKISCSYIPEVLVCMRTGGVSNASWGNRFRANRMDRKAWEVNGLTPYPWTIPLKPVRKIPQWWRSCPVPITNGNAIPPS